MRVSRSRGELELDTVTGRRLIAAGDVLPTERGLDPMLLAIDVGNTNTKFAVHDGKTWRAPMARLHRHHAHRRRIRARG